MGTGWSWAGRVRWLGGCTWHGAGLCGRPEGQHARLRLPLLVLGHHMDLVLRVPVQAAQHHVLAVVRDADLWLPVVAVLLWDGGEAGVRSLTPSEDAVLVVLLFLLLLISAFCCFDGDVVFKIEHFRNHIQKRQNKRKRWLEKL